ncbi:5-hydroxytryptamine receptor 1F [Bagarius yarrelli]|uniref:5-hydroxytryptamine receptor 1F n=1 Tax=Bagarius yarrelli TaxID=175774 RepID=A0A556U4U9_BAGYA|nr:5-hydroxytryptamine receptor 1F [Bagarius yarrelli]
MDSNSRHTSSTDGLGRSPAGMILLSFTLSVLTLLTTAINSLVITAIIVTRKLHHPANYLICSLAVTDLLVAILVMPFSIVYIVKETWVMGEVMCTIWLSVDITCCTCSILHLAAIALDRYRAITDAVEYSRKRTSLRAAFMISVVWLLSILISLPPMIWGHHKEEEDEEQEKECLIKHENIAFTLYSTVWCLLHSPYTYPCPLLQNIPSS